MRRRMAPVSRGLLGLTLALQPAAAVTECIMDDSLGFVGFNET